MGILSGLLLGVFAVSAVLLIIIILMQDEQSDGLGGIFGGGSSNQVGNRKGNILTKVTTVLGVIFLAVAFLVALLNHVDSGGVFKAAAGVGNQTKQATDWWTVGTSTPALAAPAASSTAATSTAATSTAATASSTVPAVGAKPAAAKPAPAAGAKPAAATSTAR